MVRVCYQTPARLCESSGRRDRNFSKVGNFRFRSLSKDVLVRSFRTDFVGFHRVLPVRPPPLLAMATSSTASPSSASLDPTDPASRLDARGVDAELAALPAPPRRERTLTLVLMAVTIVASLGMSVALNREVSYALSPKSPLDLGDLVKAAPPEGLSNRYVRAEGLLSTAGAIRYERPMEGDSFRLAPLAGQRKVWVEIRVPEGLEGPKFTPPTTFAGRLVPFHSAGIRHLGLTNSVQAAGLGEVPEDALLLVDGASPRASRWALALTALFAYFAAWNAVGLLRLVRRVPA
jgi:hypothetical protein